MPLDILQPVSKCLLRCFFKAADVIVYWWLVAFDDASFSEIVNSVEKIPLFPLSVGFVVVVSARFTRCFITFSVVAGCIEGSTDGLDRADFKGLASFNFLFHAVFFEVCALPCFGGLYLQLRHLSGHFNDFFVTNTCPDKQ